MERGSATMPISKLGQRRQVVIPKDICEALGLEIGDFVEVRQVKGSVVIKPKKLVDADEVLTPSQKVEIDARLAEGLEDIEQGRVYGPFDSVAALHRSLREGKSSTTRKQSTTS
jgi:AbrB family looped-hinge helix DNA binding protein